MAWSDRRRGLRRLVERLRQLRIEGEDDLQGRRSAGNAEFGSLAETLDLANVIIHDLEGNITYWTTGCERLYGWTRQEAVGQAVHDLLKTKYPLPRSEIVAALSERGSWQGELEHQTKAGSAVSIASLWVARK